MDQKLWPTDSWHKLGHKLRMIVDGDQGVNLMRAAQCGSLRVPHLDLAASVSTRAALDAGSLALDTELPSLGSLDVLADGVELNVFLDLHDSPGDLGLPYLARGNQAVVTTTIGELKSLSEREDVIRAEIGSVLRAPDPVALDDGTDGAGAIDPPEPRTVEHAEHHASGEGVLIGIIDVQGFDFAHHDFLDAEDRTRFVRIWDQGGEGTRPAPAAFNYGAEFAQSHLRAAIQAAPGLHIPATDIERQSQQVAGSHGTHVASIAAGNTGLCCKAKIAGVVLALAEEDHDRRRSFYDSTRLVHALEYLFKVAGDENCKAVAINISLGTNGHAHDASDPVSRWLDAALVTPGRAVCVAAGNAGQERPAGADDIGFVTGRIHTAGKFTGNGQMHEIRFRVVGNTIEDISENELEIWYSNRDRLAVEVIPPTGSALEVVEPGVIVENEQLPGDGTLVSIYNRLYHPANGDNVISVYLSPFYSPNLLRGIRPGVWTVRLHARDIRDGDYHGWLERDDPRPVVVDGPRQYWNFPSFFTEGSNVDDHSLSSLGCGERVIAVANLDEGAGVANISSSQGPTRDGRFKPDLTAPGTGILAARGFDGMSPWTRKTGTSMASPYVCGVVGLMLGANPRLTAAQVAGILQRTARPLGGAKEWRDDIGYGAVDPEAAVLAAKGVA